MALKRVNLIVKGRVQDVFFQASAQREARRLGLTGWVGSRRDGSIELAVEGEEESLREIIAWTQRGPTAARVDGVDVRWRSYLGQFHDFRTID
ncbi:MAG: acylphosphatase [Sorangium cellulosum]|nr:MAG: acylphosphatase [Sorangium cellulosum]